MQCNMQSNWRWCNKCQGLFFAGTDDRPIVWGWARADFDKRVAELNSQGYQLMGLNAFVLPGNQGERFNAIWVKTSEDHPAVWGWARADFDKRVAELNSQGYQLMDLNAFVLPGNQGERFNAIWVKTGEDHPAVWGWVRADFDKRAAELNSQGYRLMDLNAFVLPGNQGERFNAIWVKTSEDRQAVWGWARADFDKRAAELNAQDYRLMDFNVFVLYGSQGERFNAIWANPYYAVGVCPARGTHNSAGSGDYSLIVNSPNAPGQVNWRWCSKCQGLFFAGGQSQGNCPAGSTHSYINSGNYSLVVNSTIASGQANWRWCSKCQGLFFAGGQSQGNCPAGGTHSYINSGNYKLMLAGTISVDLRPKIIALEIPIHNQGNRSTCSVFASTFLIEFLSATEGDLHGLDYSEEYLNYATNLTTGVMDDGDFFENIAHGYADYGIVDEAKFPFQSIYNPDLVPDASLLQVGKNNRYYEAVFIRPNDSKWGITDKQVEDIKNCLNAGIPVATGIKVVDSSNLKLSTFFDVVMWDEIIDPSAFWGHSIALIGYVAGPVVPSGGYFIFRNSGGPDWGDHGYGYLSFEYLKKNTADAVYYFKKGMRYMPPRPKIKGRSVPPRPLPETLRNLSEVFRRP